MILPTPDFDPLFAKDGIPFQTKMIQYIQREFADVLGSRAALLQTPGGLDLLAQIRGLSSLQRDGERRAA